MRARRDAGFSLIEMLVSLAVLLVCFTALAQMMIQSSRAGRSAQARSDVQASARNCLTMIVHKLRSAGWDPLNAGIEIVALDPDSGDLVSEIEVFSDLDEDGATNGPDEQVSIRHVGRQVLWRRSNDVSEPYLVLAGDITNDANGDGTPEPMFVPDSATEPSRIVVRITAQAPVPDPVTRQFRRYTIQSEVALRKAL